MQLEGDPFLLTSVHGKEKLEDEKRRRRAKLLLLVVELGPSQEPLVKLWVLGLTWFVWKDFSRGQSGITLQIASSHGRSLHQRGLWWVSFRLGAIEEVFMSLGSV